MDKLLYQLAIMHDLQNGRTPASYRIADGGGIKTYSFEKLGEEVVETPLGSFDTIKILRHKPGSSRKYVFWCAPDLEYSTGKGRAYRKGRQHHGGGAQVIAGRTATAFTGDGLEVRPLRFIRR